MKFGIIELRRSYPSAAPRFAWFDVKIKWDEHLKASYSVVYDQETDDWKFPCLGFEDTHDWKEYDLRDLERLENEIIKRARLHVLF